MQNKENNKKELLILINEFKKKKREDFSKLIDSYLEKARLIIKDKENYN